MINGKVTSHNMGAHFESFVELYPACDGNFVMLSTILGEQHTQCRSQIVTKAQ